jgi:hypothetical protein
MPDWTLADAAAWLDPAVTEPQLRSIVNAVGVQPVPQNNRPHGHRGRPTARYDVAEIIALHAALYPWLARRDPANVADAIIVT